MTPPPTIQPLESGSQRPFWSVMIPTYNRLEHLRETIDSVLRQDHGPELMQIEVVDNCSDRFDPKPLVEDVGKGRVVFTRNERNLGMAGNFNRCVERARGEWVHILHSDDFVDPKFYASAEALIDSTHAEAVAFRCFGVDDQGIIGWVTPNLHGKDVARRVREAFSLGTPVQCPGVVVQRRIYEKVGGFRPELQYCLDAEMWSRVFFNCRTEFRPECLASYREHPRSGSAQLKQGLDDLRELLRVGRSLEVNLQWDEPLSSRYRRRGLHMLSERAGWLAKNGDRKLWRAAHALAWHESRGLRECMVWFLRSLSQLPLLTRRQPAA